MFAQHTLRLAWLAPSNSRPKGFGLSPGLPRDSTGRHWASFRCPIIELCWSSVTLVLNTGEFRALWSAEIEHPKFQAGHEQLGPKA